MKTMFIAVAALAAVSGVAQAAQVSDLQLLQAARCRGLASSEALGKLDTAAIDSFLKTEIQSRDIAVRTSVANKMAGAAKEAGKASGAKKDKLVAERDGECAAWIKGG